MRSNKCCFFLWSPKMLRMGAYHFFGVKPHSYASRLVDNLYDFYVAGASNLKWQYLRYYKNEFSSFQEFLAKRYNMYPSEVEEFCSWRSFVKELKYEPNLYIEELIQDERMAALLQKYLGEIEDEN